MNKLFIQAIFTTIIFHSKATLAAGNSGGHGSPADLKWAFVNTIIFFGILGWALKNPLKNFFQTQAKDVKETFDRAKVKSKEAEVMHKMYSDKLDNIEKEKENILTNVKNEIEEFRVRFSREMIAKSERLKRDAQLRVASEKISQVNKIKNEFVEQVCSDARTKIKRDQSLSEKVTDKLMRDVVTQ